MSKINKFDKPLVKLKQEKKDTKYKYQYGNEGIFTIAFIYVNMITIEYYVQTRAPVQKIEHG